MACKLCYQDHTKENGEYLLISCCKEVLTSFNAESQPSARFERPVSVQRTETRSSEAYCKNALLSEGVFVSLTHHVIPDRDRGSRTR